MAQRTPMKPVLQKPPGYRDPSMPGRPVPGHPPRKPGIPPYLRKKQKRRRCGGCCRICCCVFCAFLLIVVALASGIFYLIFDPRLPAFHLLTFQIPKFEDVSKPDGAHLDVQAVTIVELKNHNPKLDVYYSEGFKVSVRIGEKDDVGLSLGTREVKGFTQRHRNMTKLKVEVGVKNKVMEAAVAKKLTGQYKSKEIRVRVEGKTRIGYVINGWRVGTVQINVLCGGVRLKTLDAGDMPKCTINAFRWINIR